MQVRPECYIRYKVGSILAVRLPSKPRHDISGELISELKSSARAQASQTEEFFWSY